MDEITLANDCLQLAKKDFGLEDSINLEQVNEPHERLIEILETRIKEMLDTDFMGLMNAFYRIDLSEKKIQEIIELADPSEVNRLLATAVIEREKQKVITRQQYRQQ